MSGAIPHSAFVRGDLYALRDEMPKNSVAFAADLNGDGVPDVDVATFHSMPSSEQMKRGASFTGFVDMSYAMGRANTNGTIGLGPRQETLETEMGPSTLSGGVVYENHLATRLDLNGDGLEDLVTIAFRPSYQYYENTSRHTGRFEDVISHSAYTNMRGEPKTQPAAATIRAVLDAGVAPVHTLHNGKDMNGDRVVDTSLKAVDAPLSPSLIDLSTVLSIEDIKPSTTHKITPLITK